MSEAYGHKWSVLVPVFALMVFTFASAVAKDLQTLMITRFFAGVFGCAPSATLAACWRISRPATKEVLRFLPGGWPL